MPATTNPDEPRTYLVGLPVVVTIKDDGSVTLGVCAEDIVEAVADTDGIVSDDAATVQEIVADSAAAGKAFDEQRMTAYISNFVEG